MDEGQVIAEAVKVLRWADDALGGYGQTEYSEGFDAGFHRGVEHLAEFLIGHAIDWDALVEAKGAAHV